MISRIGFELRLDPSPVFDTDGLLTPKCCSMGMKRRQNYRKHDHDTSESNPHRPSPPFPSPEVANSLHWQDKDGSGQRCRVVGLEPSDHQETRETDRRLQ